MEGSVTISNESQVAECDHTDEFNRLGDIKSFQAGAIRESIFLNPLQLAGWDHKAFKTFAVPEGLFPD